MVNIEVWRFEKTSETEKNRFRVVQILAQRLQRHALCDQRERQLVFFVAERAGNFLKERFVHAVVRAGLAAFDLRAQTRRFFL